MGPALSLGLLGLGFNSAVGDPTEEAVLLKMVKSGISGLSLKGYRVQKLWRQRPWVWILALPLPEPAISARPALVCSSLQWG